MRVKIRAISSVLPAQIKTSAEVEETINRNSPGVKIPANIIELITGIKTRRYVENQINTSDLAAEACQKVLAKTATDPSEIDLLIFASAGQDLVEPATSHITQHKLKTNAAVMDIKNACNSFINGLQVAEGLLLTGQYKKVLVTAGETPSKCIKWSVKDKKDLRLSFPGYTFGDAGAAALLEVTEEETGIFYRNFKSVSKHWNVGTLAGGGSMHPRGDEFTYFRGDGTALKEAFNGVGPRFLADTMKAARVTFDDFARILVHQVSLPFLEEMVRTCDIPRKKLVVTLPEYGNMAAATLPVGFDLCETQGGIKKGDKVLFIGLAGGISLGIMMFQY